MENASKALLIAAAVLIAILLIAFGMKILNSTNGTTDSAKTTMDAAAVTTFNKKFTPYFGTNKTKSDAISLCNIVVASNKTSGKRVLVTFKGATCTTDESIINTVTDLSPTKKYKIESINLTKEGYLEHIKITEQS